MKTKYERLLSLKKEQLQKINVMIITGKSAKDIAQYIQNDLGMCKEVKIDALRKQISRYTNEALSPLLIGKLGADTNTNEEIINTLSELSRVANMQRIRVDKLYSKEMVKASLDNELSKEIITYSRLLSEQAKLHLGMFEKSVLLSDYKAIIKA